jgi:glucose-6-phosphate dehydrogenase assembly protein OpcA
MFYPIADLIIIDSELCWDDLSAMEELQVRSNMLVDLQWIGLSPWREQLKSVFDRPAVKNSLKQGRGAALFDIQIKCGASEIAEPLLLAGWILTRLKLEPTGFGVGVFECIAQDGGIARLKISRTAEKKSAIPGVQSLTIFLRESSADIQPDDLRISIRRTGELLETEIHAGDIHKMSASLESQDLVEKLRRFFLIGESTANYPATLKAAIDLSRLRQGYGDF